MSLQPIYEAEAEFLKRIDKQLQERMRELQKHLEKKLDIAEETLRQHNGTHPDHSGGGGGDHTRCPGPGGEDGSGNG